MFSTLGSVTWPPIISNSALAVLKITTAVVFGSISVLSNGLDTSVDALSAYIAFVGIRVKGAKSCPAMNCS